MNLLYKKILDVEIRHDYYRAWEVRGGFTNYYWPENYSTLNDLDFIPTPECRKILRNQDIVFKKSPLGFRLFVRALPSTVSPGDFQTFVRLDDDIKLSFFVITKNSYFSNFTNIRLTSENSSLYYFNNKNKTPLLTNNRYLSLAHRQVNVGDTDMQLGDIVENGGALYELTKNIFLPTTFTLADGVQIQDNAPLVANQTRYVTAQDRLKWQFPDYRYADVSNTNPGEAVLFELRDIDGNNVDLGEIPNSGGQPQANYQAPQNTSQGLVHTINLSHVPSGKYTMRILRLSSTLTQEFFLLNPLTQPDAFGIIELFADAAPFEFIRQQGGESIIEDKTYKIRFKNRTTVWEYFDKNEAPLAGYANNQLIPLSQQHTEFEILSKIYPDPDISAIYPQRGSSGFIDTIFSKTYLNI